MARSKPQAGATPQSSGLGWLEQHPAWVAAVATLLVLIPFANKPFNVDDPLFVWIAKYIQAHPLNPYGSTVNWYGYDAPVWFITKNPPLACYYLSFAGGLFGWTERALHLAYLLPAVAAIVGTHRLAGRFCKRPLLVAFLTLLTPVFMVSSTTIMCDVPMLAFWVWALDFWIEGTERKSHWRLGVAAALISLAALTKYFGACLIPLVAVWSIGRRRPAKEWLGWIFLPVIALIAYQLATRALYGQGLLADAGAYATTIRGSSTSTNIKLFLSALTFTGGCLAPMTLLAPFLCARKELVAGFAGSLIIAGLLLLFTAGSFDIKPGWVEAVQVIGWAAGGTGLLVLAGAEIYRKRDTEAVFLGCWIFGTFVFAAFCNWIINGRSLLPLATPLGILLVRRLEQRADSGIKFSRAALIAPGVVGAGMALAIWVAFADFSFASASQTAAEAVDGAYGKGNHRAWFQGHWGFQYYMEKGGATALDLQHLKLSEGDYIAMPSHNSNIQALKEPVVELDTFSVPFSGCLTTMNRETGAGFYASLWGPLPFAFGRRAELSVTVFGYDPSGELQKAGSQKSQ